ncbi:hypothetical protein HPB47_008340 [Ixodes persulcatus]|uniref:Uncharacterized protein n=1 Tax=Ixodes persulcatus TaxID=34615 RepID=A0AC60P5B4_IXOPE|nr:hypothetical protein HPB47_008340 [Ixodes persulcatus]
MEIADTDQGEWYDAKTSKKRKKNSSSSKSGDTVTNSPTTTVGLTVIFVPAVENQKITAISSLKLSVALEQLCPECIHEIRPNSRLNLIAVDTRNGQTTRALLACTHICGLKVRAYEPVPRHFAVGVIKDVDTSLSDAEIEQHMRSPEGRVARIRRLGQSSIVKIAFSETTLPSFVYLGHVRHPVTPFKERPIQCRKCCGYEHREADCKRPPICSRCGEAHDGNDTCSGQEKCANCSQAHAATSFSCPKWQRESDTRSYARKHAVNFRAARSAITTCTAIMPVKASASPMRLPQRTVLFEVAPYAVLGEVRTVRGMTYPVVRVKRERDVLIPRHRDSKCFEKQRVLGNSATRDTTPDLTFVRNAGTANVTWSNTTVDLGSERPRDHRDTRPNTGLNARQQAHLYLVEDAKASNKTIETDVDTDKMDSRLAHLIEAKNLILARWTKQRLNRRLRKKVAELNRSIEEHCRTLNRQQWDEMCNAVDGQLHNGKAWSLLKHLLDATNTKSHQRDHLARLIHKENGERGKDRITNRRSGMREENLTRLIHSFVVCNIAYVAAFHYRYRKEEDKINVLIRRVYKIALGLSESTGTDRLFQLGIHNTLNEIAEAQRTSQLERLSGTNAGRRIPENLGIGYHTQQGHTVTIAVAIRQKIRVDPVPRNVHPENNRGRREAQAKALLNAHSSNVGTRFVDAAEYEKGSRFAYGRRFRRGNEDISKQAEEIAVALALTNPACKTVLCDSREVIRNFAKGRISLRAARIISQRQVHREPEPPTRLLWFPAHVGEVSEEHRNGNETAHARPRELTNRTGDGRPWYSSKDRMTSYNEITKAFRLDRRTLPPPSDKLDRTQAVALRQLQKRTYPNPAQYHRMFPEIYTTNTCKVCRKQVATLTHMLWDCTKDPHGANSGTLPPRLSTALCSPSLDDQLWAVQQACEAVKRQDFDAPRRAKRTSGNAPKRVT